MYVSKIKKMAVCAVMGALSFVLMLIAFSTPFVPSFIEFDISELPALITAFAYGPICGIGVCLVKNLLHLFITSSLAVGELSNFLLGAVFVGIAGVIYKYNKTRKNAVIGATLGASAMALISVFTNYFIVYPMYTSVYMTEEAILGMYRVIYPGTENLFQALVMFNLPFTFIKEIIVTVICALIYKKLSPILKKLV